MRRHPEIGYQILKSILDGAVASRLIAESPCKRIVLPRVPNSENLYLTAEEVERLVAVVDPPSRPSSIRPSTSAAGGGSWWG